MSPIPWFKVDDGFHGHPKVAELAPADVGIWLLAGTWCAQYLTDGRITPRMVQRLGGTDENIQALVDAGLWLEVDGAYQFKDWEDYQPVKADVEAEREAARERMRALRAKKKGVNEHPEGTSEDVQANTFSTSEEVRSTPTQPSPALPININTSPATPITRNKPARTEAEFEQWWQDYPKKVGKKAALKAFAKARREADLETLTNALRAFNQAKRNTEKQYLPNPATWLNEGRWEDDYATAPEQEDYAWKIS